jgi:subtilase family serine protease
VAKVKAGGTGLSYAGYIGGAGFDVGASIAVDAAGNVYLAGATSSDQSSFPATVGPDLIFGGSESDAFVAKLSGKPDLTEASIVFSPSLVKPGGQVTLSDAAINLGLGTAKPSTTRYYLSTDTVKSADDILLGSRAVPSVEAGSSQSGGVTATVPANTPLGFYNLLVCADDGKVIVENDETDDCVPGNVLQVTLPDLVETAVSEPPQTAKVGSTFSIGDTAGNKGVLIAPASTTRYYLSKDGTKGTGDIPLIGTRAVPTLGAKRVSVGSVLVKIPNAVPGPYHVLACADDANVVKEADETNNCAASVGLIQVTH